MDEMDYFDYVLDEALRQNFPDLDRRLKQSREKNERKRRRPIRAPKREEVRQVQPECMCEQQ